MSIYLGNLSIKEMQERTGVVFPEELVEYMEDRHQGRASNIEKGKWHCFDMPFMLVCGDMETAQTIYGYLKDKSASFKEPLQISLNNG